MEKLGVPTEENWPKVTFMKGYKEAVDIFNGKGGQYKDLKSYLREYEVSEPGHGLSKHIDEDAIDLISRMLEYDPKKRITAAEALNHKYFKDACLPSEIPKIDGELKELNFRDERNQKIQNQNNNQKNVSKMPYVQPVIGQGSPDPKPKA